MHATERGDITAVKLLLDHKADVNLKNILGITALRYASELSDYTDFQHSLRYAENRQLPRTTGLRLS